MNIKDKQVLVTGADGFIGSHLVERLLQQGAKVKALVLYNSFGSWGLLEQIESKDNQNLEVILGDINDPHFCMQLLEGQEIVFHLAALINIPYSYVAPRSYFETNILGTINLLEAARHHKVKKFLSTSTSEVYGTATYSPMDEEHPLQAQSPYAASKVGSDKAVMSYFLSFDSPVTIVRPFNNFGPRQSARAVIPTIISQLLSDKVKEVKLGSLKPVRDYIYAQDTAEAFIRIALADKSVGEIINVGVGDGYSIEDIYKLVSKKTGVDKTVITDDQRLRPEKSEVWKLVCDNSKMVKLIDWKPEVSFEEGLDKTIEWIKTHLNQFKPEIYNI